MDGVKLQQFEGPLDLLLSLIEEKKLDITTVALAEVTEQFLQHIRQLQILDPTVLADFLAVAAKLLVIKSKAILPSLEVEGFDEDPENALDLEARLMLYKKYKEAGKYFKILDNRRKQGFLRSPTFEQRVNFFPDSNVDAAKLYASILKTLSDLRKLDSLPKAKIKEAVSIQQKIDSLRHDLSHQVETKLSDLLKTAKNKSEIIVTFLALLELIKQKVFTADQEMLFADVVIKKYEQKEAVLYE